MKTELRIACSVFYIAGLLLLVAGVPCGLLLTLSRGLVGIGFMVGALLVGAFCFGLSGFFWVLVSLSLIIEERAPRSNIHG